MRSRHHSKPSSCMAFAFFFKRASREVSAADQVQLYKCNTPQSIQTQQIAAHVLRASAGSFPFSSFWLKSLIFSLSGVAGVPCLRVFFAFSLAFALVFAFFIFCLRLPVRV